TVHASPDLTTLARDAQTFVGNYAAHPVSSSTPHIYISALPLSSPTNKIRLIYQPRYTGLIQATGTLMDQIDKACLEIWSSNYPIRSASFSADRRYIVLGDEGGRISVQDPHNGKQFTNFRAHLKVITSVAFSSDATLIVSSSYDYTLCIWRTADGSLASGPFKGHTRRVNSAVFSPDGMRVVSSSDDHDIRTWSTTGIPHCQSVLTGHSAPVKSAVFSPDGLRIASCSGNRSIHIWDALSGVLLLQLRGHTRSVECVRYSPCGTFIFSGSNDGTIRMWNAQNGTLIGEPFQGHSDCVSSIAVSPEGERIVSGSLDRSIRVWHRRSGKLMAGPFEGHIDSVRSVEFSTDGARIISASDDKSIRVWNAQGKTHSDATDSPTDQISDTRYSAISPDGIHIASEHADGSIRLWNVQTAELEQTWLLQDIEYRDILLLAFSFDGTRLFVVHQSAMLRVFSVQAGKLVGVPCRFSPHQRVSVSPLALSSDGVSAVSTDGIFLGTFLGMFPGALVLDLWDLRSDQLVCEIKAVNYIDLFTHVDFASSSMLLATGTSNGVIDLWDRYSGQHLANAAPFNPGPYILSCLSISPDGTRLTARTSGTPGYDPCIYDLADGTLATLPLLGIHQGWFPNRECVKLSPNGPFLAFIYEVGPNYFIGLCNINDIKGGDRVNGFYVPTNPGVRRQFGLGFIANKTCLVSVAQNRGILVLRLQAGSHSTVYKPRDDGWIMGANSKVVWAPPEIRSRFPPANGSTCEEGNAIAVDYDNMLIGDKWSQCYIGE
ncbi:hypothetical protein FRC11_007822, partial [Ceratobasidium sp. 423]